MSTLKGAFQKNHIVFLYKKMTSNLTNDTTSSFVETSLINNELFGANYSRLIKSRTRIYKFY